MGATEESGMSDTSIAIKIAGEDAQHHAAAVRLTSDDEAWVKKLSDAGKPVRIRIPEGADTEGHELSTAVAVVVDTDDDDTEGHALSLHFPSIHDANEFRRRMLAAGLITATIAVGAAGGVGLGTAISGSASSDATTISGQYDPANMGGTPIAAEQAGSIGQFDATNMGGTPLAPQRTAGQGQWDTANMGGTPLAPAEAGQGQYDPANMGGTPLAPQRTAGQGQWDTANMGGTPLAPAEAGQGQYNPANMGGTPLEPEQAAGQGQYNPANMGGTPLAPEQAGQGQYDPANMGGTPQPDDEE
jgi:hypothetical protein